MTFCVCLAMDNMRLAREIEERQRYNALQMKKSSKETIEPRTEETVKPHTEETIETQTEETVRHRTESDEVNKKTKKSQQL